MENKNKVLLTVIGVATLLVALVGATFAYFSATDDSETVEITTGAATIVISAENNKVSNIKPTTFVKSTADDGTNKDVVRIKLDVTGSSDVAGSYNITMKEPAITLEEGAGQVSDIMYAVYKDGSNTAEKTASFTGTATPEGEAGTVIVENATFTGGEIADTYYVYVYVNNRDVEQNNLQNLNFKLTFAANATTA